jgi:S-adenosylhomocysteine hydrolase
LYHVRNTDFHGHDLQKFALGGNALLLLNRGEVRNMSCGTGSHPIRIMSIMATRENSDVYRLVFESFFWM